MQENFYTLTMIISIITFAFSTAMTPGPNNIMLLSSGLTFGFQKTLAHMFGIILGFPSMVLILGFGLGSLFETFPSIFKTLKIIGVLYLIWMAYKIANNKSTYECDTKSNSVPFTLIQSAMFQWVNPKAWIMAITAISIFVSSDENSTYQVLIIAFIYFLVSFISTSAWTLGGVLIKKFIQNEKIVQRFNIIMAFLLVLSVLPIIFE